jgi:6-pyruvoyltetrahydropterin/6-carboxytetrahydropterin synthase
MINIEKKYHFYAAHRNELINDKCKNLHGHTYYATITVQFEKAFQQGGITMLFSDIDSIAEPIFKQLDHAMLIHETDPLLDYLRAYIKECNDDLKMVVYPYPTSCENIAQNLLNALRSAGLNVVQIKLKETVSSTVTILSFK